MYINNKSNHPPTILKQLTKAIAKYIYEISSNENKSILINNEAHAEGRITENINYTPKSVNIPSEQNKHKWKTTWFKPTYCSNPHKC